MSLTTIGIAIIAIAAAWLAGGFVLRFGGALLAFLAALVLATTGDPDGIAMLALGLAAWLAGHWHYAARHHYFKSPLAERVFGWLPVWLDPTCDWAVPVAPQEERRGDDR